MRKTRHDGDCSIYSSLMNGMPEDGICTCGYGHQLKRGGDLSEMYSEELLEKLERENRRESKEVINKLEKIFGGKNASEETNNA